MKLNTDKKALHAHVRSIVRRRINTNTMTPEQINQVLEAIEEAITVGAGMGYDLALQAKDLADQADKSKNLELFSVPLETEELIILCAFCQILD